MASTVSATHPHKELSRLTQFVYKGFPSGKSCSWVAEMGQETDEKFFFFLVSEQS
jgi:hypothetical protein